MKWTNTSSEPKQVFMPVVQSQMGLGFDMGL